MPTLDELRVAIKAARRNFDRESTPENAVALLGITNDYYKLYIKQLAMQLAEANKKAAKLAEQNETLMEALGYDRSVKHEGQKFYAYKGDDNE